MLMIPILGVIDHECILKSAVGKPGAEKDEDVRNAA